MTTKAPRIVIGGTSSGSGKTTITMGLLKLFKNRHLDISSFKVGPDYIDPMFHKKVLSTNCNNLDLYMLNKEEVLQIFLDNSGKDLSIIEGVMGFYDGIGFGNYQASTYDTAKALESPVILIINCKGIANSILAVIKGYYELKDDHNIKGIILNNISSKTYQGVKGIIEEQYPELSVVGYVEKLPSDCLIENRHLGLITAEEIEDLNTKIDKIAKVMEKTIDLDLLLKIASEAPELDYQKNSIKKIADVRIGVARDKAFCFYYDANIELLKKLGAEIVYFSPLSDKNVPNVDALYFGGGYPELYLDTLSNNLNIKKQIYDLIKNNIPVIAECGGFMYLTKSIDGYPMVGVIDGECSNQKKLVRFGYVELEAKETNVLCDKGEVIRGHEFHYYDTTNNGSSFTATKTNNTKYDCINCFGNVYAGFPHIHFYSNINFVKRFILNAKRWRENNG